MKPTYSRFHMALLTFTLGLAAAFITGSWSILEQDAMVENLSEAIVVYPVDLALVPVIQGSICSRHVLSADEMKSAKRLRSNKRNR